MKVRSAMLIFCAFCTVCVSAQWTWRNPLPQGNILSGLHFLSPSDGFAVGGYGTVMKTQDGGASWILSQVNVTATAEPTEIFMTSSSTGYLIDWYGEIYRTQDGAQSWFQVCDLDEYLEVLWFLNDSVGFVIGDGLLKRTTDFGVSWEDINTGVTAYFRDICFSDSLTGYVSGTQGIIFKTINAGESWFLCGNVNSSYVMEIRFVNDSCGFAISSSASVYRTNDGGINWTQLVTFDSCELKSLFPFNGDTILISGEDESSFYSVPFLYRSVDGGINWTLMPLSQNLTDLKNFFGFPDGTVYATNYHSVVKSNDYGANWLDGSRDVARNIISDIHFPSVNTGYALSSFYYSYTDTRILKTMDGGESWDSIANLDGYSFNSIFFTSENHGIISGEGAFQTWDGGITWSEIQPGISGRYDAVWFSNPTRGFIVSDEGKIAISDDSGQSWSEIQSGTTNPLCCIHFPDPNHGFIAGYKVFLRTSDGGDTWTLSEPFGERYMKGIFFINPDTGYACGNHSIFKTIDGGENWSDISFSGPLNGWNSICFIDADTGYVAGWEWYPIMKTRNGGQTWEKQHLPTRNWIQKILFTTPETGFAVGLGSTIISTTNGGYTGIGGKQNYPEITAQIYPNPANLTATVEYSLDRTSSILITVYSTSGKVVYNLTMLVQQAGVYKLPLSVLNLPNGLYFCRISCEDRTETIKVVVQH